MTAIKKTEGKEASSKKAPAKKAMAAKKDAPANKVVSETEPVAVDASPKTPAKKAVGNYIYALGRRKSASAQTRLFVKGGGVLTVNGKPFDAYFTTYEQRQLLMEPLIAAGRDKAVDVDFRIEGGGLKGQAEAARLGLSRALIKLDEELRKTLKPLGLLKRDARVKERKKPGLKKARRAPQWAKR